MQFGDAVKTWAVELGGEAHQFRMEHNFWSAEKKYFVDDELLEHVPGGLKASASFVKDVPFNIGGHLGKFQHSAVGRVVFYDLYVDGKKIEGEEKHAMRMPPWAIVLLILALLVIAALSMRLGAPA